MTVLLPGTVERQDSLWQLVRGPFLLGCAVIALCVVGLAAWGGAAPLAGAAIATGQVVVESYRKTVQHFEGGIVREIAVEEGDTVRAGQLLFRLDDTKARTTLDALQGRYFAARAQEARLMAERDEAPEIVFPPELLEATHPAAPEAVAGQRKIFVARRTWLEGQIAILRQQISQLREEIAALQQQVESETRQSGLIAEEVQGVESLVNKGLERRPRLLALQRSAEEIGARRSDHLGQIARAQQKIGEAELQITDLQNKRVDEIMRDLRKTQEDLFDLQEKLLAARDVLERTVVRAPRDGVIVNRRVHTIGGVVNPGDAVVEIVPQAEDLIIEARVRMDDIDEVRPGLPVQVRLTAYKQRWTPTVDGTVRTVSADRLQDSRSGDGFFTARIALDPVSLAKLPNVQLYPGMPADVLIVTESRTALDYMLSPITESLSRAFREQ
ncbi:MAG TPA: HlyD family type I secretion periplasmic adaptor subunit [Alphaproteobacteria bacterium]|nr:HlyD family type I secretion periplasmic adaptor subunit [Alphaproteobacteria bacterium]